MTKEIRDGDGDVVGSITAGEVMHTHATPFGLRFLEAPVWVDAAMTTPTGVTGTPDNDYDDDPS